jgi:hypothetical protein
LLDRFLRREPALAELLQDRAPFLFVYRGFLFADLVAQRPDDIVQATAHCGVGDAQLLLDAGDLSSQRTNVSIKLNCSGVS